MKEEGEKKKLIRKGDMLLLLAILLFSGIFWLAVHFILPKGDKAVVTVDGKTVLTLDLSEDAEQVVSTDAGTNTILISGGKVSVSSADCPDKLCVKHSAIHTSGDTIVCLPHKLVVEVESE